jgi:hypothetical protein
MHLPMVNGHRHDLQCSIPQRWTVRKGLRCITKEFVFYVGTLDVWDMLFKQNEPTLSIQVVDEPLHCLRVQEPHGRLVAVGSQSGVVTLVETSDNLCIQGKAEKISVNGVSIFHRIELNFFFIELIRCLTEKPDVRRFWNLVDELDEIIEENLHTPR